MTEIVSSIKRVTDIMGEISAASTEQSAGVAQMGEAVSQMDQATQQNAALVEESAAAAESLKQQAQQLVQSVAVFKLAHGTQAMAARFDAATPAVDGWKAAAERRGPGRAKNVVRPSSFGKTKQAAASKATVSAQPAVVSAAVSNGTDDWQSF